MTRYAIYWTPPEGALAQFGAAWLGWDSARGRTVPHPDIALPEPIATLTERPRKYGLHGTIKPPFFLAPGTDLETLKAEAKALCTRLPALDLSPLTLSRIGGFLALTIDGDQSPLADLAAEVVRGLDAFRAPPTQAELDRRRRATLSPAQEAHLAAWGYPYVIDQFRFHITLTGRVKDPDALIQHMRPHLAPLLAPRFTVRDLTLLASDAQGRFHQIMRLPLLGPT